jgi:hypothetical protein
VALTRLRIDELVNAWIGDECTPFQIALLGVFDAAPFGQRDGTVDMPRIRAELAARADRVPALGQRVIWTHGSEGRPVWVADPSYDPATHLESATLPAGADLASWVANRILQPLNLDRPLWRAEVIGGLPGARFAVLIVVHHVLADGRAGVALAGSLLDFSSDGAAPAPPAVVAPPLPSHRELVHDRRREMRAALWRLQLPAAGSVARLPRGLRDLREGMADLRAPVSRTSLPQRVGTGRRLAIVRRPLDELQRTGHALGVTLNDLLLAAVTGGLRDQLTARGDPVAGLVLRTTVPAATGGPVQAGTACPLLALRACTTCSIRPRVTRQRRSFSCTSCADSQHRSAARETTFAAAYSRCGETRAPLRSARSAAGVKSTRSSMSAARASRVATSDCMCAASQSLAMIRCRSPITSASPSTSSRVAATFHDACIAPASHSPPPEKRSASARRSPIMAVSSAGRPSPSRNSTPSSAVAASLFRSSAPA